VGNVVILGVAQHVRRQDRYSITVEDDSGARHRLVVSDAAVFGRGLREGLGIDADELRGEAEEIRSEDLALVALGRRAHSVREMERLLARRGIGLQRAGAVVTRLMAAGLLDDARFASDFARARLLSRGASVWSLRRDLARKGVERSVADAAIAEVMADGGIDELDITRREGRKKWRTLARLAPEVARRRLMAFLGRRGFSGDAIRIVMKELREEGA
jgi:regulatory protein